MAQLSGYAYLYSGSELHLACAEGDLSKVEKLLSDKNYAKENINLLVYDDGFQSNICPLHLAVEGGFIEICELLLQNDASTSLMDGEGYTPLHIACNIGSVEILQLLLEYGADPETIHEKSGGTSLQEAVCSGSSEMVEVLLKVIKSNDFINMKDHKGWSALHLHVTMATPLLPGV